MRDMNEEWWGGERERRRRWGWGVGEGNRRKGIQLKESRESMKKSKRGAVGEGGEGDGYEFVNVTFIRQM